MSVVVDHTARRSRTPCTVWIRQCRRCGADDHDAAVGHPQLLDDLRWRCRSCASTRWTAVARQLALGPVAGRRPSVQEEA